MQDKEQRSKKITLLMTEDEKKRLADAAWRSRVSLTRFIVQAGLREAAKTEKRKETSWRNF